MGEPVVPAATDDSVRLRAVVREAVHRRLLPAVRDQMPEIVDRIAVLVTSSVAYGTADQYSDLDVFVIFRRHRDYLRHSAALHELIDGLDLDDAYGDICDKGMRFELESLERSDLSGLYYHPERARSWSRQTEWLLCWFLSSIPLHDPAGVHRRVSRRAGRWPDPVRRARQDSARTRIRLWSQASATELRRAGRTFAALRTSCRAASAALDLAYLAGGRPGPHPKWRHARAQQLLAGHPLAGRVLRDAEIMTDVVAAPGADVDHLAARLLGCADTLAPVRGSGPAGEPVTQELARHAWPVAYGDHTTWITRHRDPGEAFHRAACSPSRPGDRIYLAEELGTDYLLTRGYSYDQALRIADPLRWLAGQYPGTFPVPAYKMSESRTITRRRWLYLNFLIWRKLRVVDKAHKRAQPFTCRWYQMQVIEHLVEAFARCRGTFAPPPDRYDEVTIGFLDPPLVRTLTDERLTLRLLGDVEAFLAWGWEQYARVQQHICASGWLPPAAAADPLATQWHIQYWKYENLFI